VLTILKVTGFGLGTSTEGALYLHVRGTTVVQEVRVPSVELPLVTPLTLQVKPRVDVPLTVAVKVREPPRATEEAEGTRVRVTVALAAVLPHPHASAKTKHDKANFFIGIFPPGAS
jgi:hypothetical protein